MMHDKLLVTFILFSFQYNLLTITSYSCWIDISVPGLGLLMDLSSVSSENKMVLVVLALLGSDATRSRSQFNMFFSLRPSYIKHIFQCQFGKSNLYRKIHRRVSGVKEICKFHIQRADQAKEKGRGHPKISLNIMYSCAI